MTILHRAAPDLSPAVALDVTELRILDALVKTKTGRQGNATTVSDYTIKTARLGGYLNRASDPPPENMVMWRGMSKLNDVHLGFQLAAKPVGN